MRTSRLQLLAAAGVAVASLALTACQDGTGTRDEGASASRPVASAPSGDSSQAPKESASDSGGNDSSANGSSANGSSGDAAGTGDSGGKGSSAGKGSPAGKGSASGGSDDGSSSFNPCNGSNTSVTAEPVSRPVNHMLITVENTGSQNCDLTYYPVLRFDEMQWVPQPIEDSSRRPWSPWRRGVGVRGGSAVGRRRQRLGRRDRQEAHRRLPGPHAEQRRRPRRDPVPAGQGRLLRQQPDGDLLAVLDGRRARLLSGGRRRKPRAAPARVRPRWAGSPATAGPNPPTSR